MATVHGRCGRLRQSLLIGSQSARGVCAMLADTDGIEVTEDNAGAILDETLLARRCRATPF